MERRIIWGAAERATPADAANDFTLYFGMDVPGLRLLARSPLNPFPVVQIAKR